MPSANRSHEIAVFISVGAVFPGLMADESTMLDALAHLSRDDALFFCARLNAIVSGFTPQSNEFQRQNRAISLMCSIDEINTINAFATEHGGTRRVVVFFRGQILELARWIAKYCHNHANDGETFQDPKTRSAFFRAALIASDLWSRRIFGDRLSGGSDPETQLHRGLGALRKGVEEAAVAPHAGMALGRGWLLFSGYVRRLIPDFDDLFLSLTGLTLYEYFICAGAMMMYTFSERPEGPLFQTNLVASETAYREKFELFLGTLSQTPDEFSTSLWNDFELNSYRSLRQRPILKFDRDRSVIIDPTFFTERLTIAPIFQIIDRLDRKTGDKILSFFGRAFEEYANYLLQGMYPTIDGLLVKRLLCNVIGQTAKNQKFEVDAILIGAAEISVFEIKSAWIREDAILSNDHEKFLRQLRQKYGAEHSTAGGPLGKQKGVAQLAKSVGAISRGEWLGPDNQFAGLRVVYPVLIVHDERMAAPGIGKFLDNEFQRFLGSVNTGCIVRSLIIITISDLENLASSIENFSLNEFLDAYSRENPNRMQSVHNFMASSEYADKILPSQKLIEASNHLMDGVKKELFPARNPTETENNPTA